MTAFTESTVEEAALRDALLPKLLSGAVRLPRQVKVSAVVKTMADKKAAERFAGAAGE